MDNGITFFVSVQNLLYNLDLCFLSNPSVTGATTAYRYRQPSTFFHPVVVEDQSEVGDQLIVLTIRTLLQLYMYRLCSGKALSVSVSVQIFFVIQILVFLSNPSITGATTGTAYRYRQRSLMSRLYCTYTAPAVHGGCEMK